MVETPRGIRNNNPGNIDYTPTDKWQGLSNPPSDGRFCVFDNPVYGIRALARTLVAYQDKHNCRSVNDFIDRYAPPVENNTDAYKAAVATYIGVPAGMPTIDVHNYNYARPFIEAIIQHENGGKWSDYYTSDQIDKGLVTAGIEPPRKSLAASAQVVGGTIAAIATATPAILPSLQDMQTGIQPYIGENRLLQYLFVFLALAGIAISLYAKYKERQKGIS